MAASGKYRESVVTFLDILGFGEIVDTKSDVEIFEIMQSLKKSARPDELSDDHGDNDQWADDISFVSFSDCVVRVRRLDGRVNAEVRVGHLFHEVWSLAMLQIDMLQRGIFLRGGVTLGPLHHENDILYGPGLVRAYLLESKVAKHPRIIVDGGQAIQAAGKSSKKSRKYDLLHSVKTRPELVGDANLPHHELKYIMALTSEDPADGCRFVDYLKFAESENDDHGVTFSIWEMHQRLVQDRLARYASDTSGVLAKYQWLAEYHNRTMDAYSPGCLRLYGTDLEAYKV